MKPAVQDGVSPAKSSLVSLEKGLTVKRDIRVLRCAKIHRKIPVVTAVAVVVGAVSAAESLAEVEVVAVVVTGVVEERRWRSEVRWSRTSR